MLQRHGCGATKAKVARQAADKTNPRGRDVQLSRIVELSFVSSLSCHSTEEEEDTAPSPRNVAVDQPPRHAGATPRNPTRSSATPLTYPPPRSPSAFATAIMMSPTCRTAAHPAVRPYRYGVGMLAGLLGVHAIKGLVNMIPVVSLVTKPILGEHSRAKVATLGVCTATQ